jgi:hypothetical protein
MRLFIYFLLVLLPVTLQSQTKNECRRSNDFSSVMIFDNIIATLERGDENKLCAGTDTQLDDLNISIDEGVLRIRKIEGTKYEHQPKVRVIYKNIHTIEGLYKADIDTRNLIKSDSLTISLKSGSRLYAGCDVNYLEARVSEGSLLKIDGYAVNQIITATSKATFSGFELEGEKATIKANMGGILKLNIEKSISGSVNTKGHLSYKNTPALDVKTGMGGQVVKMD